MFFHQGLRQKCVRNICQDCRKPYGHRGQDKINLINAADDEEPSLSEDQHKSIRKSSPFFAPIEAVVKDTNDKARKEDEAEGAPQKIPISVSLCWTFF